MSGKELEYIKKEERNYYSSFVTFGKNLITALFPLIIAGLFYICNLYNIDGYKIIFTGLILVYIIAMFFTKNIKDYTPKRIQKSDIADFMDFKKHRF